MPSLRLCRSGSWRILLCAALLWPGVPPAQGVLEEAPEEPAALLGLGDIQLRNRQPRLAAEFYRRAVAADPRNPDAYARLGEGYYQQRDPSAALSAWEQALALREDIYLRRRVEEVQERA